jgi:7,8-dihydroneopterin aldolase/epimerase/oxygenase
MGQLILENMEFYAFHGHFQEEQTIGGRFRVDLIIETDLKIPAETDQLEDAVDYSILYELVKKEMGKPSRLIEHLARRIADAIYEGSGNISGIKVTVSKLNPAIGGPMEKFSVVYSR